MDTKSIVNFGLIKFRLQRTIQTILIIGLASLSLAQQTDIQISGQLTGPGNTSLAGCHINLSDSVDIKTTSDQQGRFSLSGTMLTPIINPIPSISSMVIKNNSLILQVYESRTKVTISIHDIKGQLLGSVTHKHLGIGEHNLVLPQSTDVTSYGINILKINLNGKTFTSKWNRNGQVNILTSTSAPALKYSSPALDTQKLVINCDGYFSREITLANYTQNLGTLIFQQRPPMKIKLIGTNEVWDEDGDNLNINRPLGSQTGDLLVLFLHRTDSDLPLFVDGWTRAAECYKTDNGSECGMESNCRNWHDDKNFCRTFHDGGGHDLAQSVFYKTVGPNEPNSYNFTLNTSGSADHPGWIILIALRGADTENPVRDWSNEGSDGNRDSMFPSVYGEKGDMLLLSQSFDDYETKEKFLPPDGTTSFGYVGRSDETGYLFGGILDESGETGVMRSNGPGGPDNKDALVSITIRADR